METFIILAFGFHICLNIMANAGQLDFDNATVVELPCNIDEDVKTLTEMMTHKHGKKIEEIIDLVTQRTGAQRQQIRASYANQNNGADLKDVLYEYAKQKRQTFLNTNKDHADALKDIFRPPTEYLLSRIAGTYDDWHPYKDQSSAMMLIPCSAEQVKQINALDTQWNGEDKTLFQRIFKNDLGNQGTTKTEPIFSSIVLFLLGSYGYRSNATADPKKTDALINSSIPVDPVCCSRDNTQNLFMMLATESFSQLNAVAVKYNQEHTTNIFDHLQGTCTDNWREMGALLGKICCRNFSIEREITSFATIDQLTKEFGVAFALDRHQYFADIFNAWMQLDYHSVGEMGQFIVISRSDIDLESIKAVYKITYKSDMVDDFTQKMGADNKLNARLYANLINGNRR